MIILLVQSCFLLVIINTNKIQGKFRKQWEDIFYIYMYMNYIKIDRKGFFTIAKIANRNKVEFKNNSDEVTREIKG